MVVLRFIGSWFLAFAALALINDVTRAWAPGTKLAFLSVRGLWQLVNEGSLTALQAAVQRSVHPLLWDPALVGVLKLPAWFLLGALGLGLCLLGRRRRGVEVFTN